MVRVWAWCIFSSSSSCGGLARRVPPTSYSKRFFPCILSFWALILHFGLLGLHFLAFWLFGPVFPFILALWACISLYFGLAGLHFLAFLPFRPSFPCILTFRAFISLHFGFMGIHFRAYWPFRGQLVGPPPHKLPKMVRFPNLPYKEFSSAVTDSILQFLAFWAISLHFGVVGLHFLAFWPASCGTLKLAPSAVTPVWAWCIFSSISSCGGLARGVLPTSCQKRPVFLRSIQRI